MSEAELKDSTWRQRFREKINPENQAALANLGLDDDVILSEFILYAIPDTGDEERTGNINQALARLIQHLKARPERGQDLLIAAGLAIRDPGTNVCNLYWGSIASVYKNVGLDNSKQA